MVNQIDCMTFDANNRNSATPLEMRREKTFNRFHIWFPLFQYALLRKTLFYCNTDKVERIPHMEM